MGDNEVLRAMRAVRFETMGTSRTYYDFFVGFGHSISVATLLQSVLLWQLATIAKAGTVSVPPMIGAFVVASAAGSFVAWHFIFPLPAAFSLLLTACLIAALLVRASGRFASSPLATNSSARVLAPRRSARRGSVWAVGVAGPGQRPRRRSPGSDVPLA